MWSEFSKTLIDPSGKWFSGRDNLNSRSDSIDRLENAK